jgi:2-oxoglutarate ferredoxin oxidoreductase subunit alpha
MNKVSNKTGLLEPGKHYLQGNEACVEAALIAGCRVYAGYPITPATEAMEAASRRFPEVGGRFIQMEDEIGSVSVLLGSSWAGTKAMTATSGPGFSLMQEAISIGIMTETPLVVIDIQRPGPGQGYITASQEDVMQARWGHHGQGPIIALAPSSVQEMFDLTVEAFNLSETWRTPVMVMAEQTVAHMHELVHVPPLQDMTIRERKKPQDLGIEPDQYQPWGHDLVPPMATWGEGYNSNFVALVHHEDGNVTRYNPEMHYRLIERLDRKIEGNVDKIALMDARFVENSKYVVISYGVVARSAMDAVYEAREQVGLGIGHIQLKTLWPFPEEQLRNCIDGVEIVFVPEMNLGMMKHPVTEALRDRCRKIVSIPSIGTLHSPDDLLSKIYKEIQ